LGRGVLEAATWAAGCSRPRLGPRVLEAATCSAFLAGRHGCVPRSSPMCDEPVCDGDVDDFVPRIQKKSHPRRGRAAEMSRVCVGVQRLCHVRGVARGARGALTRAPGAGRRASAPASFRRCRVLALFFAQLLLQSPACGGRFRALLRFPSTAARKPGSIRTLPSTSSAIGRRLRQRRSATARSPAPSAGSPNPRRPHDRTATETSSTSGPGRPNVMGLCRRATALSRAGCCARRARDAQRGAAGAPSAARGLHARAVSRARARQHRARAIAAGASCPRDQTPAPPDSRRRDVSSTSEC
jgi:hypothetical protein